MGAGGKCDNHLFSSGGTARAGALEGARLMHLVLSEKASGSMVRFAAMEGPHQRRLLLVGTKNGTEETYLRAFERVLEAQMGPRLRAALWAFLMETGWTLAGELVVAELEGTACDHGARPRTDHLLIHGGTKPDQSPVNPLDLLLLRATLGAMPGGPALDGLWFPRLLGFEGGEGFSSLAVERLEEAFEAVNNAAVWPHVRRVAPCPLLDGQSVKEVKEGEEYQFWCDALRAAMVADGGARAWEWADHSTAAVDHPSILEGWIVHHVFDYHLLLPGGGWQRLACPACRTPATGGFDPARVLRLKDAASGDAAVLARVTQRWLRSAEGEEEEEEEEDAARSFTRVVKGFRVVARPTLEEMLVRFAADDAVDTQAAPALLRPFLWHLVAFAESTYGVACGVSKHTSFGFTLAETAEEGGHTVLSVTLRGEAEWFAYDAFFTEQTPLPSPVRLSRGFSMRLVMAEACETETLAIGGAVCPAAAIVIIGAGVALPENREKYKLANYVLRTMLLRAAITQGSAGQTPSVFFRLTLVQMRRWRVHSPEARAEVLKLAYLVAAYGSGGASAAASYLHVLDALQADLAHGGHANVSRLCLRQLWMRDEKKAAEDKAVRRPSPSGASDDDKDDDDAWGVRCERLLGELGLSMGTRFAVAVHALEEPMEPRFCRLGWLIRHGFAVDAPPEEEEEEAESEEEEPHAGLKARERARVTTQMRGLPRGFMYQRLRNSAQALRLKEQLVPLADLLLRFHAPWLHARSAVLRELQVVLVAATPGAGKSVQLEACEALLRLDFSWVHVVRVSSDDAVKQGGAAPLRLLLAEAEAALRRERRRRSPSPCGQGGGAAASTVLLLDRCSASQYEALRRAMAGALLGYRLRIHLLLPYQATHTMVAGNGDWYLPYSMQHMALAAGAALTRTAHVGRVEGAHGFDVALAHLVGARLPVTHSQLLMAHDALAPIATSFTYSHYADACYAQPQQQVPPALDAAVRLGLGLQLSRETRRRQQQEEAVARGKTNKGKGNNNDADERWMLRELVLALSSTSAPVMAAQLEPLLLRLDTAEEGAWARWLAECVAPVARAFQAAVRLPADAIAEQMLRGMTGVCGATGTVCFPWVGLAEGDPFAMAAAGRMQRVVLPFVPSYFALQPVDAVGFRTALLHRASSAPPIMRTHDLHVTVLRPPPLWGGAIPSGLELEGLRAALQGGLMGEEVSVVLDALGRARGSHIASVLLQLPLPEGVRRMHMTLLCAGPNKDAADPSSASSSGGMVLRSLRLPAAEKGEEGLRVRCTLVLRTHAPCVAARIF